jgi:retinol dehydrogenase 14
MAAPQDILSGKTVLVTGSTDGIGRQTVRQLGEMGARVLVHGRDPARVDAVLDELSYTEVESEGLVADLASLSQIRRLAAQVAQRHGQLHVLINNAGVYMDRRELTEDGYETTFAVNHLAPFLLTNLLLPLLEATPGARIVNLSSGAHRSGYIDWHNLEFEESFSGYQAYALSKLCNVLFTFELADRLRAERKSITANCLHPGVIDTKLLHAGFQGSQGADVREGARTPVYLASSPQVEGVSGVYFVARRPQRPAGVAYDRAIRRRLWSVSAALVGLENQGRAES